MMRDVLRAVTGLVASVMIRLRWLRRLRWVFLGVVVVLLLFGWLILTVVFGFAWYQLTLLEAQLQGPVQMSPALFSVLGTDYQLNVLFPSKVTPGKPIEADIWVTCPDPTQSGEVVVTAINRMPFMLKNANNVLKLKPILSGLTPLPSEKSVLEYDIIPGNLILPQTQVDFLVEIPKTQIAQTFTVKTLIDSFSLGKVLWVEKIASILAFLASLILPLVFGLLPRRK
jgi:hypothetical protein